MAIDEQHVALPTLYGAPAYARPAPKIEETPRPLDPDDLPIEAFRTNEEQQVVEALPEYTYSTGGAQATGQRSAHPAPHDGRPQLRPRPLSLRAITGRLRGGES